MEQTIGKRIMSLRKSRGMTQSQLAEQLGISAQAVSKWENDTSCPDITLLPKLAEIFQITTDALLGVSEPTEATPIQPQHVEEPITQEDISEDEDSPRCAFTMDFELGRADLPWFATAVLLFAVSFLLNRTLLADYGEAGIWSLIWPSAMMAFGLCSLWQKLSLWAVGMVGFGGYYLLANMHILPHWTLLSWKIILPLFLVVLALHLFADHFREKPKRHIPKVSKRRTEDGIISCECAFCSDHLTVDEPVFRGCNVDVSFGDYTLDLTACSTVEANSPLNIDLSFGSLTVKLPKNWKLQEHSDRSFSSLSYQGCPDPDADQLLIANIDLSFGNLDFQW